MTPIAASGPPAVSIAARAPPAIHGFITRNPVTGSSDADRPGTAFSFIQKIGGGIRSADGDRDRLIVGADLHLKSRIRHGRRPGGEAEGGQADAVVIQCDIAVMVEGQLSLGVDAGDIGAGVLLICAAMEAAVSERIDGDDLVAEGAPRVMSKLPGGGVAPEQRAEVGSVSGRSWLCR